MVRRLRALEHLNASSQYEMHSRTAFDIASLDVLYDLPVLSFVALVSELSAVFLGPFVTPWHSFPVLRVFPVQTYCEVPHAACCSTPLHSR